MVRIFNDTSVPNPPVMITPTGLKAIRIEDGVLLTWDDNAEKASEDFNYYNLYRRNALELSIPTRWWVVRVYRTRFIDISISIEAEESSYYSVSSVAIGDLCESPRSPEVLVEPMREEQ